MIKKRVTSTRRVVSHFDPALANIDSERLKKYGETLDIKDLGDLSALPERPTVFEIAPLKSKYEYLAYSQTVDYWSIFSTHVVSIEGIEMERTPDGDISPKERDTLPTDVVQNICSMIVSLATSTGAEGFFSLPGGFWAFISRTRARNAAEKMGAVASEVATDSAPK
jgi:hypothetical protein